ncbi:MAG: alpha/beta fold hydrolase [Polyangiaceae bacterium]
MHRSLRPARLGLVICNPFGFEAVCAHRSLRHFAQAAAEAGFPALRFDYDGTGDSAGDDRDPDRLFAWVASVRHAIEALPRLAGIERVVVMGVRLGAMIAALAAAEQGDVHGLIAIAPVVAGKTYLRELRALQMSLGLREPAPGAAVEACAQEAIGFCVTSETHSALTAVDLTKLEPRPAPRALLLERNDLPASDGWASRLASQGVAVDRRTLGGYVEMVLDPEFTVVPSAMVSAVVDWLSAQEPTPGPIQERGTVSRRARFDSVVESAETIATEGRLFGILSEPVNPSSRRRGILLVNAGAIHRIGPNRSYVAIARRWAALGHAVLRMDMSGIGDSRPRPGDSENVVYANGASDDVAAGLAFLRTRSGVAEVHALGLCSGGYHAFKAAVAGIPMDSVLLINPLTFSFEAGIPLSNRQDKVASEAARYKQRLKSPEAWRKLLRGDVKVDAAAKIVARRLRGMFIVRLRELAQRAGLHVGTDLERELEGVVSRGTALRMLFSGDDPGLALLEEGAGPTVDKLRKRGKISIAVIDGPDHTFTARWSQLALIAAVAKDYD